jgi:hypothetical protein
MQTKVVNLYKQPYDVYIGRGGHGKDGYFENPYRLGHACGRCGKAHTRSGEFLDCYKAYFLERVEKDLEFRRRVLGLRGKRLGCSCKPAACHGDVIVEWLEQYNEGEANP